MVFILPVFNGIRAAPNIRILPAQGASVQPRGMHMLWPGTRATRASMLRTTGFIGVASHAAALRRLCRRHGTHRRDLSGELRAQPLLPKSLQMPVLPWSTLDAGRWSALRAGRQDGPPAASRTRNASVLDRVHAKGLEGAQPPGSASAQHRESLYFCRFAGTASTGFPSLRESPAVAFMLTYLSRLIPLPTRGPYSARSRAARVLPVITEVARLFMSDFELAIHLRVSIQPRPHGA
jgi:hypothetical protein